jgi:peptidyl-prolyl cis-trans isomerase C
MPRTDHIRNAFIESGRQQPRYIINWRDFMIILLPSTLLSFAFWSQAPPAPKPAAAAAATQAAPPVAAPKAAVTVKPGVPRVTPPAVSPVKAAAAKAVAMAPKPTKPANPNDPIVLSIGEERITKAQFEEILAGLPNDLKGQMSTPEGKREFAKQYAEMKALAIEGEKKMKADQKTRSRWQVHIDQTLANLYMRDASNIDEATIRKYYDEHPNEFENANGRHILVRFKGSPVPLKAEQKDLTDEEALAKINDISKRVAAGEDFAEIAKKDSDDTGSGAAGGSLGDFPRGMMVPAFDQAAFSLPIGQLSQPVKTQFGYHLIQIQSRKASTFEEAKQTIERKQKPEIGRKAIEEVKKRYTVVLEESYFGKV